MMKEVEYSEQLKWNFDKPIQIGMSEALWVISYLIILIFGYGFFS
ncbi:MAG: hypothetical protein ACRCX2_04260 [Paraclostridium sp.]